MFPNGSGTIRFFSSFYVKVIISLNDDDQVFKIK